MLVSIIIPSKDEADTIVGVINACKKSLKGIEKEIIVVVPDQKDASAAVCRKIKGVKVIIENNKTKGGGMEDGLREAKGEVVVYTDADIKNPSPEMIDKIASPVIGEGCDFVKGSYNNVGRVTEFVVRPLLSFAFPEVAGVVQPISGQIAGKKKAFERLRFNYDWGVDIGILIDMAMNGSKIKDVELPRKEDVWKPHLTQGTFLEEIAETILERAKRYGRLEELKKQEMQLLLDKFKSSLKKYGL
jgi:glucosyl-3-phosphoglycerate synthase